VFAQSFVQEWGWEWPFSFAFGVLRRIRSPVFLQVVLRTCVTRYHVCTLATDLPTTQRNAWTLLCGIRVNLGSRESVQLILSSFRASIYALPHLILSQNCQLTPAIRRKTDSVCDKIVASINPTLLPYYSHPKTSTKTELHHSSVSVSACSKLRLRNWVLHLWKEIVRSASDGLRNQSQSRRSLFWFMPSKI
jgi:hypothetical protein